MYRTFTFTTDWSNPTPWGVAFIEANTIDGPSPVATPEPATLALAAAGLLAAGFARRRSRVA